MHARRLRKLSRYSTEDEDRQPSQFQPADTRTRSSTNTRSRRTRASCTSYSNAVPNADSMLTRTVAVLCCAVLSLLAVVAVVAFIIRVVGAETSTHSALKCWPHWVALRSPVSGTSLRYYRAR